MADKRILLYKETVKIEFFEEWTNPETNRINKHVYLVNGKHCPISVTGVTGMLDKPALVGWAANMAVDYVRDNFPSVEELLEKPTILTELLESARKAHSDKKTKEATSGTLVHDWAEKYIKGEKPEIPEDPRVLNGVNAFLAWEAKYKPKFLWSEKLVYSKKYGYVGIMDSAFTLPIEKHSIIHPADFKTSSGIYSEMRYQLSGYQHADMEESGMKFGSKWILRFAKDDKFDKKTAQLVEAAGSFEAREFEAKDHKKDFAAFLGLLEVKKREMELVKN